MHAYACGGEPEALLTAMQISNYLFPFLPSIASWPVKSGVYMAGWLSSWSDEVRCLSVLSEVSVTC